MCIHTLDTPTYDQGPKNGLFVGMLKEAATLGTDVCRNVEGGCHTNPIGPRRLSIQK